MIYRRRYRCPECKSKGRVSCNMRDQQRHKCHRCGTAFLLEEQNESGEGYREFNQVADWSYEI